MMSYELAFIKNIYSHKDSDNEEFINQLNKHNLSKLTTNINDKSYEIFPTNKILILNKIYKNNKPEIIWKWISIK